MAPVNDEEFSEETREATPANFLMKNESFSLLTNYGINKFESRPFDAGGYKWKLIINFEGNDVSVYFSIAESDYLAEGWEVNAIFTFCIHNQHLDYYHCFRGMTRRFNAINLKWGFSKLITIKSLMDPSKGYIVDNNCVFGAEVFVIKPQRINQCLSLIKDKSLYKRDLRISDFSKLENVWNSEEFEIGNHKWMVQLYPKGDFRAKDRYISMFLKCVDSVNFALHQKVKADGIIRIKSKLNDSHYSKKVGDWYTSSFQSWGYSKFIPITYMRDPSKGFLVDDCCFLDIEISVKALIDDAPKI